MHRNRTLAAVAVVVVLVASRVSAQEQGRVAIDLGYPPAFAVLWRVSDRLALRPDFSFSDNGSGGVPSPVWTVTPGVSALLSIHASGSLTPYAGARLAGLWIKDGTGPEVWAAAGLFGARYTIERHFGISAETGVAYNKFRLRIGPFGTFVPYNAWNVTPAGRVSALLYF